MRLLLRRRQFPTHLALLPAVLPEHELYMSEIQKGLEVLLPALRQDLGMYNEISANLTGLLPHNACPA